MPSTLASVNIPTATRNGPWQFEFLVPYGAAAVRVSLSGLSTADYENTANRITAGLFIAREDGTYPADPYSGMTWQGGRRTDKAGNLNPQPLVNDMGIEPAMWGKQAKAGGTVTGPVRFGGTVTVYDGIP